MRPILEINGITKKFRLTHELHPYLSFRDRIEQLARFNKNKSHEEFYALHDVSFNVYPGDCVGILGKNGAGKSTLLKILSRITPPTSGTILSRGRIASLLEVGTGFHPELTGRENILLNGSILGMKQREIMSNFDAIVDFSGIERFLDTPLKHYSSGMQLRLAFAVAAFLDPEILIIDEVLAVGDAEFQKKCIGKMSEVAHSGRTILFVSHNIQATKKLCTSGLLLQAGSVAFKGTVDDTIDYYLHVGSEAVTGEDATLNFPSSNADMHFTGGKIFCQEKPGKTLNMGETMKFEFDISCKVPTHDIKIGFIILNSQGDTILNANNRYQPTVLQLAQPTGNFHISCDLGKICLNEGTYYVNLYLGDSTRDYSSVENAFSFHVCPSNMFGLGMPPGSDTSLLWWPTKFTIS